MTIAQVASFLSNREKLEGGGTPDGPETRILSALQATKMVALRDIPAIARVSTEIALDIIQGMISRGQARLVERSDRPDERYLSL